MSAVATEPIRVTNTQHADLMRFAFNQVCNQEDWKAPIDCLVPWELANVYIDAITFMTGVRPSYLKDGSMCRLTCIGYRAGPAGG